MGLTQKVFLSRDGKIFGPFSQSDITQMRKRGELAKYFWICSNLDQGWVPVVPPPPLPLEMDSDSVSDSVAHSRTEQFVAICHNFRTVLSGTVVEVHKGGCTLTQVSPASMSLPVFRGGARIHLNLLNNESGNSENIEASIDSVVKRDGYWDYRLKWNQVPKLIAEIEVK